MSITLNHTIVPARDKEASAKFFAHMFGLKFEGATGHFAPVRINNTLTLDFDNWEHFEMHHYAFHVSDDDFDAIFGRVKEAGIPYGSGPFSPEDMRINDWRGGRGVYFKDPNGHLLELLTRAYRRPQNAAKVRRWRSLSQRPNYSRTFSLIVSDDAGVGGRSHPAAACILRRSALLV